MSDIEERVSAVRLRHLDNLRTALVAWVIACHALLGYSMVGGWAYDEINEVSFTPPSEVVLAVVLGPSGLVIIGLFFFISGLLTEHSVDRHGWQRYTRDRMLRLGLPWLVSAFLLWPLSVWVAYRGAGRDVSLWWVFRHRSPFLDSGALWFALVLLIYSVAFAIGSALVRRIRRSASPRPVKPLTGARLALIVIAIAAWSYVTRIWFPAHSGQIGDLHLWWWPECLGMFLLGIVAARRGWAEHVPDRLRRGCGIVVLVTLVLIPILAFATGLRNLESGVAPYLGGWHWQAAATTTFETTFLVTASVWVVGMAERRLDGISPRTLGWQRAAFGAFVIQGPVLMILATAGRLFDVPAEVKAPLLAALAIIISFWVGGLLASLFRSRAVPSDGGRPATAIES